MTDDEVVLEMTDKDVEFRTIESDGTETVTINKVKMWTAMLSRPIRR